MSSFYEEALVFLTPNVEQGLRLAALLKEAGLPDGILSVVSGGAATGRLLAEHMRIRKASLPYPENTTRGLI